jgi:hypothetical protein
MHEFEHCNCTRNLLELCASTVSIELVNSTAKKELDLAVILGKYIAVNNLSGLDSNYLSQSSDICSLFCSSWCTDHTLLVERVGKSRKRLG